MEQYKIAVAGADRTTLLRIGANRFYFSVVTLMATGIGMFVYFGLEGSREIANALLLLPLFMTCILWFNTLSYHRKLNAAKFQAIDELEKLLPARPYGYEWEVVARSVRMKSGAQTEQFMPIFAMLMIVIFGALYFIPGLV